MNEGLARAKDKDWVWHEGVYLKAFGEDGALHDYIIGDAEIVVPGHGDGEAVSGMGYIRSSDIHEVNPETLCQYTGLDDKAGQKIFEGDVLAAILDEDVPERIVYEQVIWNGFSWCLKEGWVDDMAIMEEKDGKTFKVVGNIYDHPWLMEEGGSWIAVDDGESKAMRENGQGTTRDEGERVSDMDFGKYTRHWKTCLCPREGGLREKELYSVAEISGNGEFSNLYMEVRRNAWDGCACWLWNDLGCVVVRMCYVYPCYSLEKNLEFALENPVARLGRR